MWRGRRRTPGRDAWGQLTIEEGLEGREGSRAGLGIPRASPEVSFLFGLLSFSEGPTGLPDRARTGPNIISLRRETGALVQTRAGGEGSALRAGAADPTAGVPVPSQNFGLALPRRSRRPAGYARPTPWLPLLSVKHPSSDLKCSFSSGAELRRR